MVLVLFFLLSGIIQAEAGELMPWQQWIQKPVEGSSRSLDALFDLDWRNSGGAEGKLNTVDDDDGPWGGGYFNFSVTIDHHNEGKYPLGWPSFETQPDPPLDFSGYDAIQYRVRCRTDLERRLNLRFILWTDGKLRINTPLEPFPPNEWVRVTHRIGDVQHIDTVDRIHFFLCERNYDHGDEMTFQIGDFRLCNLRREKSQLKAGNAAAGLWVGERADSSNRAVILESDAATLPALIAYETAENAQLLADDELVIEYYDVFADKRVRRSEPFGEDVDAGTIGRIKREFDIKGLDDGYYLITADIQRGGRSLLSGRVGADDLYIKKRGESMTYTVLSIRAGMVKWVQDLLYGDVMCRTDIALPHTYDPLNEATYAQFIEKFARRTGKHTEGNEAGDTGLLLAAEAFRKAKDMERCRFVEGIVEDSFRHMIEKMQAPSGATITWTNELADAGIGKGGRSRSFGSYDSNQIGEWMRPMCYGIIYYSQVADRPEYARKLSAACRKAADYLVAHSLMDSDGIPDVLRHLKITQKDDGTISRKLHYQGGRQCDVYLGRALSGLSYYAYAMQLSGEDVPDKWWRVMDNTTRWCRQKMKPNGWFDWQCGDEVEGGCHTFLGNIYVGEGLFGCYLANKMAGRDDAAQKAATAATKAYHYVTDDCYIRGRKYEYPLEFWVGPYVYWLFTEYIDTIGPDAKFQDWLDTLDHQWSEVRQWRDFLERKASGGCGRTTTNGMLETAILGYPAIKYMEQIDKPLHWRIEPTDR